ncbi:hypothetical protein BD560DRAFT_393489 [Blakeslea trispora]|nr:hypothetical protein BD560DRAFT_393489 [Blakeslea trispora]
MKRHISAFYFLLLCVYIVAVGAQSIGSTGKIETNVPWRAGHAAAFQYPYVVVYGGSKDASISSPTTSIAGTNDIWAWDVRNGSWYEPTVQIQAGASTLPQIYFKATTLPSQGQIVALVSNTTGGSATGVLQKLDINSWSWSFPTTNFQASARTVGYSMLTVNNTIYTYGGISVDQNGYANTNAIQNTLSLMDANSFQWSSGSNGLGLTDHSTCYLKACNCLVTFGGTSTGNPTDVTDAVSLYDLSKKIWNVQGIQTTQGAAVPGARRLHTATCLDDMMVVYGGGTNQPVDTDVWVLNATSFPNMVWQRIVMTNQTQGPNARMGHSAVLDEANKKIYIFGGWGLSANNDSNMYVLDYVNWSWMRVATTGYSRDTMPNTNATMPNPADGASSAQGLNKGTIAGIAVGSCLGILLIAAIVVFFFIRKRKSRQEEEQNTMHMVGEEFLDECKDSRAKKDNPFYYNPGGFYNTQDDDDGENGDYPNQQQQYHHQSAFHHHPNNSKSTHRLSKAWTGNSSPRNSSTRRSEIGDSERVMTGVLEAMTDDETVAATHGSRSPRQSYHRNSKILLVTPTEYVGQGQVPNEIIYQKPNELPEPPIVAQYYHHPDNEINTPTTPHPLNEAMELQDAHKNVHATKEENSMDRFHEEHTMKSNDDMIPIMNQQKKHEKHWTLNNREDQPSNGTTPGVNQSRTSTGT